MTNQTSNFRRSLCRLMIAAVVVIGSGCGKEPAGTDRDRQAHVGPATRVGPLGETRTPFLPSERLDLPEAIAAFTINAAYVNHLEKQTGSVETGKLADLVVLDQNLFAIAPEKISDTQALVTLFEGKPVHGDLGAL